MFDIKVKFSLHNTLNTSKRVIWCKDLGPCTDDEILDKLNSEGVTHVRNIHVCKNGLLKRTNTYVLTFNTPMLPADIQYTNVTKENYSCISFCERRDLHSKSAQMLSLSSVWSPRRQLHEKANMWKLWWRQALQ